MTALPFICLGTGILIGLKTKTHFLLKVTDAISTLALILLMLIIGLSVGIDQSILMQFPRIGLNCTIIALLTILFSIICTYICEKTVLMLDEIDNVIDENNKVCAEKEDTCEKKEIGEKEKKQISPLIWIMPLSIVIGIVSGNMLTGKISETILNSGMTISLIVLYVCVGISQGATEGVFNFFKKLGVRIIVLPLAVLSGSIVGGLVASMFIDVSTKVSVIAASGMSFYSITGAFMTQNYGIAIGTYGFIVNILREVFTVIFLPILIKISPGSAIASGAAGDMDTMLAPITKAIGAKYGLVTLTTGTILTLIVPILLPILSNIFN